MSQFAHFFLENEIRSQPVTQIPWSTLSRVIIQKSSSNNYRIITDDEMSPKQKENKYYESL